MQIFRPTFEKLDSIVLFIYCFSIFLVVQLTHLSVMESELQKHQPSGRSIKDVDEFCKNIFAAIMQVVRSTHALPKAGDDHEFYSSFSGFQEFVLYQKERLIKMMSTLMKNNGFNVSVIFFKVCFS